MYSGEVARLRAVRQLDLPAILEMRNDADTIRATSFGVPLPVDEGWVDRLYARAMDPREPRRTFAVADRETRRFVGICGYEWSSPIDRVALVSISLMPTAVRLGYGTDALRIIARFLHEQANAAVIRGTYIDPNPGARRVAEKVGFIEVGRLRDHVWRDGAWHDAVELEVLHV